MESIRQYRTYARVCMFENYVMLSPSEHLLQLFFTLNSARTHTHARPTNGNVAIYGCTPEYENANKSIRLPNVHSDIIVNEEDLPII